jgi:hypothetical protein
MSIASDAPAAHTPSVMRSVSLHRKITGRCIRSNVSLGAASYGKRRKVSITIRLRRHATSGAGERESSERSSRGYQEILRMEAAMPRTARSGGVSGMLHRTTVPRADLIEGTVDSLVRNRGVSDCGSQKSPPRAKPAKTEHVSSGCERREFSCKRVEYQVIASFHSWSIVTSDRMG